jgi:hypothetical protein
MWPPPLVGATARAGRPAIPTRFTPGLRLVYAGDSHLTRSWLAPAQRQGETDGEDQPWSDDERGGGGGGGGERRRAAAAASGGTPGEARCAGKATARPSSLIYA